MIALKEDESIPDPYGGIKDTAARRKARQNAPSSIVNDLKKVYAAEESTEPSSAEKREEDPNRKKRRRKGKKEENSESDRAKKSKAGNSNPEKLKSEKLKFEESAQSKSKKSKSKTLTSPSESENDPISDIEISNTFEWHEQTDSSDDDADEITPRAHDTQNRAPTANDDDADDEWTAMPSSVLKDETTRRLAILSCDWDVVNATDLFVLLHTYAVEASKTDRSMANIGARPIQRVSIYLSDFGAERLAHEEKHGPTLIFNHQESEIANFAAVSDSESEDEDNLSPEAMAAIRKYERDRSMFCFAIVECSDTRVADYLYKELEQVDCDFVIGGALDLRVVPDDLPPFTDTYPRVPTSVATEFPTKGYVAPPVFKAALKHTKTELSWDETDSRRRTKLQRKKFTEAELAQLDLDDYLASSSE